MGLSQNNQMLRLFCDSLFFYVLAIVIIPKDTTFRSIQKNICVRYILSCKISVFVSIQKKNSKRYNENLPFVSLQNNSLPRYKIPLIFDKQVIFFRSFHQVFLSRYNFIFQNLPIVS